MIKKKYLCWLADKLEKLCCKFHWLNSTLIFFGLNHCPLALLSYYLDKRYRLGVWKDKDGNIPDYDKDK